MAGAEVWVKRVEADTPAGWPVLASLRDPATLVLKILTSRPKMRTECKAQGGGKTSVCMLRWINTRGEKGPWSEMAIATVVV